MIRALNVTLGSIDFAEGFEPFTFTVNGASRF